MLLGKGLVPFRRQRFMGPSFPFVGCLGLLLCPMPDPVAGLASNPNAKIMVFIDGQNLYKTCKAIFGHPLVYPHLLAEHLAGPRNARRPSTRFYTGRPSQNIAGEGYKVRNLDRRLHAMRASGITVITRRLRYNWEWGHQEQLPRPEASASPQTVQLRPWQRPQEKGIDAAIALEAVEFALLDAFDVAIIISLDRDLAEIPRTIRNLRRFLNWPIRLEAAVPVPDNRTTPKRLANFDYTHQITRAVFDRVKDTTNYTVDEALWAPPAWPQQLSDLP